MNIKQVIVVVKCPNGSQRVVYNTKGEVVAGDLKRAKKLSEHNEAGLTICARGQRGEVCQVIFNSKKEPVSGDPGALTKALKGHPIAQLIPSSSENTQEATINLPG